MLRRIGADLVGMSTVPEALAAKMAGIRVQAFSLVTNLAAGISGDKLDHQEVLETGKSSQRRMVQIVRAAIESLN
jgi:purine-nucleoside phosphorylase